jgi:hypothetical protein
VDASRVALLRELLAGTEWVDRTRSFGRALRRSTRTRSGLLLVGTPDEEPWHLAAHLDDESRYSDLPGLSPTLVRWAPPPGAPSHLSIGLERLEQARRGETLFVVAPDAAPAPLLERVSDARRIGATVLALDAGDPELEGLAHEALIVPGTSAGSTTALWPPRDALSALADEPGSQPRSEAAMTFDAAQHLVSTAAGESDPVVRRLGVRDRLGRLLDVVSGGGPTD